MSIHKNFLLIDIADNFSDSQTTIFEYPIIDALAVGYLLSS